jgi:hypothetical protein
LHMRIYRDEIARHALIRSKSRRGRVTKCEVQFHSNVASVGNGISRQISITPKAIEIPNRMTACAFSRTRGGGRVQKDPQVLCLPCFCIVCVCLLLYIVYPCQLQLMSPQPTWIAPKTQKKQQKVGSSVNSECVRD